MSGNARSAASLRATPYNAAMPTPASQTQRLAFALFLLAMFPAGFALSNTLDVDSWWHLRVGQYLATEQRFPDADPFSQLGQKEQTPWIAYSWLYELLLYGTYQAGGFPGVLALRHLLDLLTFCSVAWLLLRHAWHPWLALAALAAVTVALLPFQPERPWHFTICFTVVTLHGALCILDGAPVRRFAWLPLIYVLWANIHIQFVMGFAVLGLGWIAALVDAWRKHDPEGWARARGLFLLGWGCALATLLTPFHFRLYAVIWEYATQTQTLGLVSELVPPDFRNWWNWPLIPLILAAAVATVRRGWRLLDLMLLGAALFFSLRMQRDLWFGAVVFGVLAVRPRSGQPESQALALWQIILAALLAVLLARGVAAFGLGEGKSTAAATAEKYPVEALEFLRTSRDAQFKGPLFNHFDWGGYLIWALPELPVSIDGRTNLYGEARVLRSIKTWAGIDWESDPDLRQAGVIIAPKQDSKCALTNILRRHPDRWRVLHEDEVAVVFVPAK
jgi:hypothetical protein